ncbi:MAG: nucleotidyltransferase [Tannerellaceae bacterium]|nr:nucleotidyltransferase [Tannerellaceae bacterium]
MKPTLLILAAGMGSRYGGLKQLDGLGPSGETIMDYSVYDSLMAGFGKIVFVIRKHFEDDFRRIVVSKYESIVPIEIVYQELDSLPAGFTPPPGREKPWGTNHALMMAAPVIDRPFAAINADDFYGRNSFNVLGDFLRGVEETENQYAMVGFNVGKTLSESGSVARGVCRSNPEGFLTEVVERTDVRRFGKEIVYTGSDGKLESIPENTPVSMNMWGFTPDYFKRSAEYFETFLKENEGNQKSEFYIPLMVNELITKGTASVKIINTTSSWFGVTYAADRASVVEKIKDLIIDGKYPRKLF